MQFICGLCGATDVSRFIEKGVNTTTGNSLNNYLKRNQPCARAASRITDDDTKKRNQQNKGENMIDKLPI